MMGREIFWYIVRDLPNRGGNVSGEEINPKKED
jgi:hypothetical protein